MLTFGFILLTSDIAIGRRTQESAIRAYAKMRPKWKFLGVLTFLVPVLIMTYYAVITLGYSIFYFEVKLPNGSTGQLLDIMDYISNSVMMPLIALLSTILIGWVMTPDYVIGEMERNGETFHRKKLYTVMIRYVAPVMMLVLFLQSTGILS